MKQQRRNYFCLSNLQKSGWAIAYLAQPGNLLSASVSELEQSIYIDLIYRVLTWKFAGSNRNIAALDLLETDHHCHRYDCHFDLSRFGCNKHLKRTMPLLKKFKKPIFSWSSYSQKATKKFKKITNFGLEKQKFTLILNLFI